MVKALQNLIRTTHRLSKFHKCLTLQGLLKIAKLLLEATRLTGSKTNEEQLQFLSLAILCSVMIIKEN